MTRKNNSIDTVEINNVENNNKIYDSNSNILSEEYRSVIGYFVDIQKVYNAGEYCVNDNIFDMDINKYNQHNIEAIQCYNIISNYKNPLKYIEHIINSIADNGTIIFVDKNYNHMQHLFSVLKTFNVVYCGKCERLLQLSSKMKFFKTHCNMSIFVIRKRKSNE